MHELRRAGLRRVVEVAAGGYGSGYAIGDDLVLTAGHVVAGLAVGSGSCSVRIAGEADAHAADVVWTDPRPFGDAALLRVPSGPWRGEPDSGALRWGRVAGDRVACAAMGFPRVQEQADGIRDIESISGTTDATSAALLPRYEVNVTTALPRLGGPGKSGWQGLSGAALLGPGRQFLGVITADALAYAGGRLEAVPAQWLLADPDFAGLVGEGVVSLEPVRRHASVSELDDAAALILTEPHQPLPPIRADYQLLQAKYGMVPFVGRDDELAALTQWWQGPQRFGMAVVTGDAGAGKTRLGAQLCRLAAQAGWSAGFARLDRWDEALSDGGTVEIVWPTLAVVDYPDRLTPRVFEFLHAAMGRHRGARLRVLLLDRTRGTATDTTDLPDAVMWWRDMNRHSGGAARLHTQTVLRLQAGLLGAADRQAHAIAAARAFSGDGPERAVALDLTEAGYANPLRIHLATLLALRGRAASDSRHAVAQFVARERDRWTSRAAAHHVQEVSEVSLAQAVALTTLTTPSVAECPDLLTTVPGLADPAGVWVDRRLRLTAWLRDVFPGDDDRIAPLEPDLLAQQLLAETPGLPALALAVTDHSGRTAAHLNRMINILQLAGREDAQARGALQQLLAQRLEPLLAATEADPQLPALLTTAVALCAEHGQADDIGLAVAGLEGRPAAMDPEAQLWKALTGAAVAALGSAEGGDADRTVLLAELLTDLVAYHSILEERQQALARAREAHALLLRLGEHAPSYGMAVVTFNLGTCLGRAGVDLEEAATHLRDAAARLATLDDLPMHADALLNLTACQADRGDRASAAKTYVQATALLDRGFGLGQFYTELADMFRQLSRSLEREPDEFEQPQDPDAYRPPLGCAPEWFDLVGGNQLVHLQRLAARLSAGAARRMPTARRDALFPALVPKLAREQARFAASNYSEYLRVIASDLARADLVAAACVPAAESVEMLRPFLRQDPELLWQFGRNLRVLAHYQRRAGRLDAAIASAEEAIARMRTLIGERPEARQRVWHPDEGGGGHPSRRAPLPEIWLACETLADCLEDMGRLGEAVQARQQLADVLGELAELDPRYARILAEQTIELALALVQNDEPTRSAASARAAVEIYRDLSVGDPSLEGDLTAALQLASGLAMSTLDDTESSLDNMRELVERTRIAAEADPALWLDHAEALNSYSIALSSQGRYAEAETQARSAETIVAQVATGPEVAVARAEVLMALATSVLQLGRPSEARLLIEEALALTPPFGTSGRDSDDLLRCTLLSTLAMAQLALSDVDVALATVLETGDLFERLPAGAGQELLRAEMSATRARCHLMLRQPREAMVWAESAADAFEPYAARFLGARMLAQAKYVVGVSLLQLGRPQEARSPLQEVVPVLAEMAELNPAHIAEYAVALSALGNSHLACDEPAAAHPCLREAIELLAGLPASRAVDIERASAEALYSGTLLQLGDAAGAVEHGRTALALIVTPDQEPLRALVQQWVATGLAALGRPDEAVPAFTEAVELLRRLHHADIDMVTRHVQCLVSLAELRLALYDPARAERDAREAQRIAEGAGDPALWPPLLLYLQGAALVQQGQSRFARGEPAMELLAAALRTLAAVPDPWPAKGPLIATAHGMQAVEHAREGRTLEAIEPAVAAVAGFRPFFEDPTVRLRCASVATLAGGCLLKHDRWEEADPVLAEAVELFASLPELPPELIHEYAMALADLANCRWVDDAPQEALDLFSASLETLRATPVESAEALSVRAVTGAGIAEAFAAVGLLDEAASALALATDAHARLGQPYPELTDVLSELDRHLRSA